MADYTLENDIAFELCEAWFDDSGIVSISTVTKTQLLNNITITQTRVRNYVTGESVFISDLTPCDAVHLLVNPCIELDQHLLKCSKVLEAIVNVITDNTLNANPVLHISIIDNSCCCCKPS